MGISNSRLKIHRTFILDDVVDYDGSDNDCDTKTSSDRKHETPFGVLWLVYSVIIWGCKKVEIIYGF